MKRRDFIVKGGLVTAAIGTSNTIVGKVFSQSPNDALNIGVIGTGDRGGRANSLHKSNSKFQRGRLLRCTSFSSRKGSGENRGKSNCVQRLPKATRK